MMLNHPGAAEPAVQAGAMNRTSIIITTQRVSPPKGQEAESSTSQLIGGETPMPGAAKISMAITTQHLEHIGRVEHGKDLLQGPHSAKSFASCISSPGSIYDTEDQNGYLHRSRRCSNLKALWDYRGLENESAAPRIPSQDVAINESLHGGTPTSFGRPCNEWKRRGHGTRPVFVWGDA
jgi:hypothetical protein